MKVVVFISGSGTNLQALINASEQDLLNIEIVGVISNKENVMGLVRAKRHNIPNFVEKWCKDEETREAYDLKLAKLVASFEPDLVVLAGWLHVFTNAFLDKFPNTINLHPALPDGFIGMNCIEKAFQAHQRGEIKHTGSMVHYVSDQLDRGSVLDFCKVPIYGSDSLKHLEERVKKYEKGVLLSGVQKCVKKFVDEQISLRENKMHNGKVRNVYDVGYDCLLLEATDRTSSFDRHICDIKGKGTLLNHMSAVWFERSRDLVPNHHLWASGAYSMVKKCTPFKIEVVVRGYITGSTSTSLWTHYKNGAREYSGIKFPDGLIKNQKLDEPVITPTTKGVVDKPITPDEIVAEGYMTRYEWNDVREKAMELFKFGQLIADSYGFILVDTKYEFGKDSAGNILLIDELHTCDSSRYWVKDSYQERFSAGQDPEKLDKDRIRDWVKANCDPYQDKIPEIPEDVIANVHNCYASFYKTISGGHHIPECTISKSEFIKEFFRDHNPELAVVISGSEKDSKHVAKIISELEKQGIHGLSIVSSAHKNTDDVMKIIKKYNNSERKIIFVTVAGRSNALSGVVSANSKYPVIACPPFADKMDMCVNINSTLQCPSNVPVMTILEPCNVALAINKIFRM